VLRLSFRSLRFSLLPCLGFAVRHKSALPDLYEFDLAAFHLFIEQRSANAVGTAEVIYAPIYALV